MTNLNVNKIENLLLHDENQLLRKNGNKIIKILNELKRKKLIKNYGVSVYSFNKAKKIILNKKIDIIQCPINYVNRSFVNSKFINLLKKKKIKLQVRSIFHQGVLSKSGKLKFKKKIFKEIYDYINNWHNQRNLGKLQTSLNFFNNKSYIDQYIIGIDKLADLREIINQKKKKIYDFPKVNDREFLDLRNF